MSSGPLGGVMTNLRVAAISIAAYDALLTLSAEIHLYRDQKSFRKMTRACILFILIRYVSIATIIISNVGFFGDGFTAQACQHFYLFSPLFKVFQMIISQVIVALRTIAVARQAPWVLRTVGLLFVISVALEFFSNIWHRVPIQEPEGASVGNCSSGNVTGTKIAWVHYMAAMLYDATCLIIATGHIWKQSRHEPSHSANSLPRMLLREGVLYFCFLTAANVLNLVFYAINSTEFQTAGANLGYAFTWIMSQRLIIHLHEYRRRQAEQQTPHSGHLRAKNGFPTFIQSRPGVNLEEVELGVHVTVEEVMRHDFDSRTASVSSPRRHSVGHFDKGQIQHPDDAGVYEWWNKDRKSRDIGLNAM